MAEQTSTGKVLVVDDEPFVRMLIADVLDEAGFEVVEASDAQTALKRLELASDVQVLFTDTNMPPGMNGLELAEQVAQRWPQVGIVVSSGYERPSNEQIADGGIFVPKPFRPEDVVRAVQTVAPRE
jgi:CheY-like chemotaxis protein